jgi:hypothetical protein
MHVAVEASPRREELFQNASKTLLPERSVSRCIYPVSCPDHFDHPVDSPFSAPGDHSQRYHCLQCTELHRPRRKHGSCSSSHQSGGELGQAAPWPPKIGQFTLYIHHKCALPRNFARLHIWIYVPWKHGAISSRGQTCGLHPEHEFWKTLTPEVCPISASTSSRH